MEMFVGILIGLVIGTPFGMFLVALFDANKEKDDE